MEQLVLLIIIGLIYFINWLLQKSKQYRENKAAEERRQARDARGEATIEAEPEHPAAESTWSAPEEEVRRFFEALGLPQEEAPEPTRQAPPQTEPGSPAPPPLPEQAAATFRQRPQAPQPASSQHPLKEDQPSDAEMRRLARSLEETEVGTQPVASAPAILPAGLLSDRNELRKGIVLREVLGPPKGLASLGTENTVPIKG